jgi:hypothetical protein
VIHFEAICKISNSGAPFVCMSDDNDFMPAVDQFLNTNKQLYHMKGASVHTDDSWYM